MGGIGYNPVYWPRPRKKYAVAHGPRRQNLLLLPRQPAQADELHAPDEAEGAQPALAVRRSGDGVRLVDTVSQADVGAGAAVRGRRVGNDHARGIRATPRRLFSRRQGGAS